MANYLLVYHGGSMPESPEEGAKVMTAWTAWFGQLCAALVDGGNPASASRTHRPQRLGVERHDRTEWLFDHQGRLA